MALAPMLALLASLAPVLVVAAMAMRRSVRESRYRRRLESVLARPARQAA